MLKRIALYIIIVYLLLVVFFNTYVKPYRLTNEELQISSWNYALDEIDLDKTKFSYSVSLINVSEGIIFLRTLKPDYKEEVLNNIEYNNVIIVNKEIKPKEVLEVSWDIIINKKGLIVKELKAYLTSIKLNAKVDTKFIPHELEVTFWLYN